MQVTVKVICRRWCPRGLFQTTAVRINKHVTQRTDWQKGVYATKDAKRLLLELRDEGDHESILLCVRGPELLDVWRLSKDVLAEMEQVLEQWPGLVYTREVLCPACVKAGAPDPCSFSDQWLGEPCTEIFLHCRRQSTTEPIPVEQIYPPAASMHTPLFCINPQCKIR